MEIYARPSRYFFSHHPRVNKCLLLSLKIEGLIQAIKLNASHGRRFFEHRLILARRDLDLATHLAWL